MKLMRLLSLTAVVVSCGLVFFSQNIWDINKRITGACSVCEQFNNGLRPGV